jgi:hypothetical protein
MPKFPYAVSFDLIKILMKKIGQYSITSPLEVQTLCNQLNTLYSLRAFQQYQEKSAARETMAWEMST